MLSNLTDTFVWENECVSKIQSCSVAMAFSVKKVDLLATSRVEIRQLAKRSAEGAFLADNIIKLW